MARVCVVMVAGLSAELLKGVEGLKVLSGMKNRGVYRAGFPAVTCTAQATVTTGGTAGEHGIVCNGLYTYGREGMHKDLDLTDHAEVRQQVSFWEQSNTLLQRPRFWEGMGKKVAMLFWQNSMRGAADIVVTPKPVHTSDGKTLTACWSSPGDLYGRLANELGAFPLHHYWSPMAGLPSSKWIVAAAERVWSREKPDLELVYVPHLDFNLLKQGPRGEAVLQDVREVDGLLAGLAEKVRATGGVMVVMGDYGVNGVRRFVMPNLALREKGLLATKLDEGGKVVVDYGGSAAFVMCDHQVGHVYVKSGREEEVAGVLRGLEGVGKVLRGAEIAAAGLGNERSGELVVLAAEDAWLVHDWWRDDGEKPRWQFGVDIHSKPGFDTRELFFDPVRKCISQDAGLVKGSHGLLGEDRAKWPVVMSDVGLPGEEGGEIRATSIASWLAGMLGG